MMTLSMPEEYEQNLAKLRGFSVLLSSNEVRDSMRQDTATGLEYILMDIIHGFEQAGAALDRAIKKGA